ncbi:hypothetical protein [Nocardia sp. NPDC050412]|uniref:hypothetical protein n=1 Tax=Nocardia sp. NPDC050412 TaxID=3364320 RepID=UPI003798912F
MDSWQRLGATLARRTQSLVPSKFRRLIIAATTPTREYAAVMVALGMVRMSYHDRVLPDAMAQFHHLASLPKETMVRAVLGGTKVQLAPVAGVNHRGNLIFGQQEIDPTYCADISTLPWLGSTSKSWPIDLRDNSDFIRSMVPTASPRLFVTSTRTICAVIGPGPALNEESRLLIARTNTAPKPIYEILRPFELYGEKGWNTVIFNSQMRDWPAPAADKLPRLVVLDGAAAVQRWVESTNEAELVLALVHRNDSGATAAAETMLNLRRRTIPIDISELQWTPPAAVEATVFGEPA